MAKIAQADEKEKFLLLEDGASVPFTAFNERYGKAEFEFCVKWRRGKVVEVWIYSAQQESRESFHIVNGYSDSFQVSSWTHKGMDSPKVWMFVWCKTHKCMSMRVYVPDTAVRFTVQSGSTLSINFDCE